MEFDMAQAQARFVDVWGQVKETPLGTMRIGRFRQPFGMSEMTSVRELPLMERPTTFALSPFRQTGIMFFDIAPNERATYALSGFRTISDNFGNVYGDDGGYGTAERLTYLLRDQGDDCGVMHLGFDHSFLNPARNQLQIASQDEISLSQQPNLGPSGLSVLPIVGVPPFVNTGVFGLNHANSYNIESAVSRGNKLVQSEYRWTNLELPSGDNATVHGGYVTMRYVLTGETIPYNRAAGVYGRVKPARPLDLAAGNYGAWELVTRLSSLNLNPLFGLPDVPGPTRRLTSGSVGLNWYWWDNAKCQVEWVNGSLNDPMLGDSVSNTVAARFQMDF
jgi:phosphate-selective porin OprO/OprP